MGVIFNHYEMGNLFSHAPRIDRHPTDRGLLFLRDRLWCMGDREKWSLNALRVAVHGRLMEIIVASEAFSPAPYGSWIRDCKRGSLRIG